jgi:ribosome recycling factor
MFIWGEISSNFDLKNMISTIQKSISWKNFPNSPNFEGKKIQITNFL